MITKQYISKLAAEKGFAAACFCLPQEDDGAPEGIKSFVLLLRGYVPHDGTVDAFYVAKNESYRAAGEVLEEMRELGVNALLLSNLSLKKIATRSAGLTRGLNTLNYHAALGSKFCMELIGLDIIPEGKNDCAEKARLNCKTCGRCKNACPGGAIGENGFVPEKCIRYYMMSGKPMPEHLRRFVGTDGGSYAVIGCDVCQRVCPGNAAAEQIRKQDVTGFTLEEMLMCSGETLARFGEMYGRNYANRNRIMAQALLAAGNSGEMKFLPRIQELTSSPSALVRDHARWAEEEITKKQNKY